MQEEREERVCVRVVVMYRGGEVVQDGQVVVWLLDVLENVIESELKVELDVEQKEGKTVDGVQLDWVATDEHDWS